MSDESKDHPHPSLSGALPAAGSTSAIAGQRAALKSASWRFRILNRLREQPSALWEVAEFYGVSDHVISGRFTELAQDGHIERTGARRQKPASRCPADIWKIRGASGAAAAAPAKAHRSAVGNAAESNVSDESLVEMLGYPPTLTIGGELYDRQELLVRGDGSNAESYPGVPYARRAGSPGQAAGQRLIVRVELAECPGCGRSLKFVPENDPAGGVRKKLRCGTATCNSTWEGVFVSEPGGAAVLALVARTY